MKLSDYKCEQWWPLGCSEPTESWHLTIPIIDELRRPSSFVLNPDKYGSLDIACGKFLVGLIPSNQGNLQLKDRDKKVKVKSTFSIDAESLSLSFFFSLSLCLDLLSLSLSYYKICQSMNLTYYTKTVLNCTTNIFCFKLNCKI